MHIMQPAVHFIAEISLCHTKSRNSRP